MLDYNILRANFMTDKNANDCLNYAKLQCSCLIHCGGLVQKRIYLSSIRTGL